MYRVAALVVTMLIVACGGSTGNQTTTTTAASLPTTSEAVSDGVSTRSTTLGTVLVDPEGFTMYVFTVDTNGESACYDSCATLWPPVPGDTAIGPGLNPSMFGTTTRTDGTTQLTVNGQPLYLWAGDAGPGDVTGQDVDGVWFVVGSDGVMITEAGDAGEDPYGY